MLEMVSNKLLERGFWWCDGSSRSPGDEAGHVRSDGIGMMGKDAHGIAEEAALGSAQGGW
jgi:hypothetical protein